MFKILTAVVALTIAPLSFAQNAKDCRGRVESAVRVWDYAHKVYQADRAGFLAFVNCDHFTSSMGTGLHEALHGIIDGGRKTSDHEIEGGQTVWYLPTGEKIPYPGGTSGDPVLNRFPPRSASDLVSSRDPQYDFYILGTGDFSMKNDNNSSTNFNNMLDELNSYASDNRFVVKLLEAGYPNNGSSSSGLFALGVMVRAYLAAAEQRNPAAWARLRRPDYTNAIRKIWANAEIAIKAVCARPDLLQKALNKRWTNELLENKHLGPLESVLGRRVSLPSACPSKGGDKTSPTVEIPAVVEGPPPTRRPRWPVIPPRPSLPPSGGGGQFQLTIQ